MEITITDCNGQVRGWYNSINEEQQALIRKAVTKAVASGGVKHRSTIYNYLYKYFEINSYKDLNEADFEQAIELIEKRYTADAQKPDDHNATPHPDKSGEISQTTLNMIAYHFHSLYSTFKPGSAPYNDVDGLYNRIREAIPEIDSRRIQAMT